MGYVARVSNPNNQPNPNYAGLIRYCIKHQHWSVFEQAFMTLEIETTRGIAAQILRHRSFTYQEFSQRYADVSLLTDNIPIPELRRQDTKNRQNSTDDLPPGVIEQYQKRIQKHFDDASALYQNLLDVGVAEVCRIYMTGSVLCPASQKALSDSYLHDRQCSVLIWYKSLHRSEVRPRYSERTHGHLVVMHVVKFSKNNSQLFPKQWNGKL